jgi:hypothetical protein
MTQVASNSPSSVPPPLSRVLSEQAARPQQLRQAEQERKDAARPAPPAGTGKTLDILA